MTVSELIEKLRKADPNAEVHISCDIGTRCQYLDDPISCVGVLKGRVLLDIDPPLDEGVQWL